MEENKKLYPLKFVPFAEKVSWGGNFMVDVFGKEYRDAGGRSAEAPLQPDAKVGESWEIADMGWRDSVVRNGWLAANSISELMDMYCDEITGDDVFAAYGRQFPLLVKWLDVRGRMPLMAHPDDLIAAQRYDSLGKEKIWYVVSADADARLWLGFKKDSSVAEFWQSCQDGTVQALLNEVTPHAGDAFRIYPGMVHCAGGGLVLAEISEASDLDFKLYNWGLPTENDPDEPLNLIEAVDFLDYGAYAPQKCAPDSCKPFVVSKIILDNGMQVESEAVPAFVVYMCVEGEAEVRIPLGDDMSIRRGEVVLIPAGVQKFILVPKTPGAVLLEAVCKPSE